MKQTVFDVLMYLFENYMDDENSLQTDPEQLKVQLTNAGFVPTNISKAFEWLEELVHMQEEASRFNHNHIHSVRVYSEREQKKLDLECRSLLLFLEQMGVLDATSREHVIDRIMALETDDIEISQLKWVVLMVLFNQPGVEEAYSWMEHMVLENLSKDVH